MPEQHVKLVVTTDASGTITGFRNVQNSMKQTESASLGITSKIRSHWLGITAAVYLGISALDKIKNVIADGMNTIDQYTLSGTRMAAMMTGMMEKDTRSLSERYKEAFEYSGHLNRMMESVDKNVILSSEDLREITDEMIKQRTVVDVTNKNQVEAYTRLANALAAVTSGDPNKQLQLHQETRALLTGQVDQHARLASMLNAQVGNLKEQLSAYKTSGERLVYIGSLLEGFGAAQADLNASWENSKSTLSTIANQILREGFGEAYRDIIQGTKNLSEWAETHKAQIIEIMERGWSELRNAVKEVSSLMSEIGLPDSLFDTARALAAEFRRLAMLVDKIGGTLTAIPALALDVTNYTLFLGQFKALGDASSKLKEWNKTFEERYRANDRALMDLAQKAEGYSRVSQDVLNSLMFRPEESGYTKVTTDLGQVLYYYKELEKTSGNIVVPKFGAASPSKQAQEALEQWHKKLRDVRTEVEKSHPGMSGLASRIEDIKNKFRDLREEAAKKKSAGDIPELNRLEATQIANFQLAERLKDEQEMIAERRKAWQAQRDIEAELHEQTAGELGKQIASANKWVETMRDKVDDVVSAYSDQDFEKALADYEAYMDRIEGVAKTRIDRVTADYNAREAAKRAQILSGSRLAELEMMERMKLGTPQGSVQGQLDVYEGLLDTYRDLAAAENLSVQERLTLQQATEEYTRKVAELRFQLQALTGTFEQGMAQGMSDYFYDMRSGFEMGRDAVRDFASNTKSSFSDVFSDTLKGETKSFEDYWKSFVGRLANSWGDMLAEMLTNWIFTQTTMQTASTGSNMAGMSSGFMSLFGSSPSTGAHELAALGYHGGGAAYEPSFSRRVPGSLFATASRYHTGIGPGERAAIIRWDETVFTQGQLKALRGGAGSQAAGAGAQQPGAPQVNVNISAIDGPSVKRFVTKNQNLFASAVLAASKNYHPIGRRG